MIRKAIPAPQTPPLGAWSTPYAKSNVLSVSGHRELIVDKADHKKTMCELLQRLESVI